MLETLTALIGGALWVIPALGILTIALLEIERFWTYRRRLAEGDAHGPIYALDTAAAVFGLLAIGASLLLIGAAARSLFAPLAGLDRGLQLGVVLAALAIVALATQWRSGARDAALSTSGGDALTMQPLTGAASDGGADAIFSTFAATPATSVEDISLPSLSMLKPRQSGGGRSAEDENPRSFLDLGPPPEPRMPTQPRGSSLAVVMFMLLVMVLAGGGTYLLFRSGTLVGLSAPDRERPATVLSATVLPVTAVPAAALATKTVSSDTLNLRALAGTASVVVTKLQRGQRVTLLGDEQQVNGERWLHIAIDGAEGWVNAAFVE